jgi:hypothetical protein
MNGRFTINTSTVKRDLQQRSVLTAVAWIWPAPAKQMIVQNPLSPSVINLLLQACVVFSKDRHQVHVSLLRRQQVHVLKGPDVFRRQALVVRTDRMGERCCRSMRNGDPVCSLQSTLYPPPPAEDGGKNQHGGEDSKEGDPGSPRRGRPRAGEVEGREFTGRTDVPPRRVEGFERP